MSVAFDYSKDAIALGKTFANDTASNALFADVRAQGLAAFERMPFPTRKTEDWKYTNLRPLTLANYNQAATDFNLNDAKDTFDIPGLNPIRLVFVNGEFSSELSDAVQYDGLSIVQFHEANEEQQQILSARLAKTCVTDRNLFSALNNGFVDKGVLIHVAKNQRVEQPIQLVNVSTRQPNEATVFARHLIVLDTHAEATVVEQFVSSNEEQNTLVNQLSEIVIEDGAKLNHYRLHTEEENAIHIGGVYVDLNRDSQFESYQLALGGKIKRLDIVVNHNQSGSHAEMAGVYLPKHDQHVDFHTYIEHKAAHCTTNEVYRGIMADQSKAVFNGRIHIHPDAQKTLAELSNKNLLLSNKAEINTKPELEIYADDVRCAHGATVAQLDEKARFYLQSRGISRQEAEVMLSFGFINELLDSMPIESLRLHLRPMLAQQFTANKALTKHLLDDAFESSKA